LKNYRARTFVLGDLHGANIPLEQVLRKANFDKTKDTLIFIGDLADRWPEPHLCLQTLLSCKNLIPILGNHDLFLKKWLTKGVIDDRWLKVGGLETLEILDHHRDLVLEYLDKTKYYHLLDDEKFFCHGGFNHKRIITKQKKLTFAINRQMYKTACQYAKQKLKFKPIYDKDDTIKIKEIFIGHTPTKNHLPAFKSNVINVDSGAGNGGKLTLMDVYSKKYVQAMYSSKCYKLELK
jgi:serine/threonine protein phosphatase 1